MTCVTVKEMREYAALNRSKNDRFTSHSEKEYSTDTFPWLSELYTSAWMLNT